MLTVLSAAIEIRARRCRRCCEPACRLALQSARIVQHVLVVVCLQFLRDSGSQVTPITIPTNIPMKVRPVCHSLKSWFFWNMSANASFQVSTTLPPSSLVSMQLTPKKRYSIPVTETLVSSVRCPLWLAYPVIWRSTSTDSNTFAQKIKAGMAEYSSKEQSSGHYDS